MKKSARNRIIIWSVVSVVLIAVLVAGLKITSGSNNIFSDGIVLGGFSAIENSENLKRGNAELSSSDIDSILVEWSNGSVEVITEKTDKITIYVEEGSAKSENDRMHYINDNGTLKIYSRKITGWNFWSDLTSKKLVITVPESKNFEDFKISTASAGAILSNIKAETLSVSTASGNLEISDSEGNSLNTDSASGNIILSNCNFEKINSDIVSGVMKIDGTFSELNANGVSGEIYAQSYNNFNSIEIESVSGGIHITLPETINGIDLDYDTVSGKLESDFPTTSTSGSPSLDIDTVSGNIEVLRAA